MAKQCFTVKSQNTFQKPLYLFMILKESLLEFAIGSFVWVVISCFVSLLPCSNKDIEA